MLAFESVRARILDPLRVITCFHHFNMAGLFNQGALIVIQALVALTEHGGPFEEGRGLFNDWATAPLPPQVDINLRVYARSLQVVTLDMRGLPIDQAIEDVARLVAEAADGTWGAVIASVTLATRLYRRFPQIANRYLVVALRGFDIVTLPDGEPIPRAEGVALEGMLWVTANAAASDADVDSWIEAVKQLSNEQVRRLADSDLAPDNAVILTDGIWLREYRKAGEKDWDRVEALVSRLQTLAEEIRLLILRAAAIRTLIMLRAEFRNDIDGALSLAEAELKKVNDDESVFLIVEVAGRQLSYAKRSAEAIAWLRRARSIVVRGHSLWRRNVLVTLGEEEGRRDPRLAAAYIKEALDLSRAESLGAHRIIEVLGEYSLALWNAGDAESAFAACEEAVLLLLSCDDSDPYWIKLFLAIFQLVTYLSSMALYGGVPDVPNYQVPEQGWFLGLDMDNFDTNTFAPAQKAFLRIRMAMFAEGIGRTPDAGKWTVEALAAADQTAGARTIDLFAWLDLAPEILKNNYGEAVRMALLMADSRSAAVAALEESGLKDLSKRQQIQESLNDPLNETVALMLLAVALICRLATLQLRGTPTEEISIAIESIRESRPGEARIERIVVAFREGLLEDRGWSELRTSGEQVMSSDAGLGLVYYFASALRRPLAHALTMHVWLAQNTEKMFHGYLSLLRTIILPFFGAFCLDAVRREPEQFRTAEAYTRRRVEAFADDTSLDGVKQLLSSMAFCLGESLPESAKEWLASE